MLAFLLRYYLNALFNWVLLPPLFLSFIHLIELFSNNIVAVHLSFTLICFSVICSNLFAFHKKHMKMFALFPIPTKIFVAADYLFLSVIAVSYATYSVLVNTVLKSLLEKQLVLPSLANWYMLLCATFILLTLFMMLRFTKFQFLLGLYPLFFPLFFSIPHPYLLRLTSFIPLLFTIAILSFGIGLSVIYYLSKRRDIVW